MLFLLKRQWRTAAIGLVVLGSLGIGLRALFAAGPDFGFSPRNLLLGLCLFVFIAASDGILHVLLLVLWGPSYRIRYHGLAGVFAGQTVAAMLVGAGMAGIGEELLFRGVSVQPFGLGIAAIIFGMLHHVGPRLWLFTIWSAYQGLLLAVAVYATDALFITMVAHFLHDFCGFLVFRLVNQRAAEPLQKLR
jgi:membrane protease YdiL (CAAX protease family)